MRDTTIEQQFAEALKSAARRQDVKQHLKQSPLLYGLVSRAARRFVTGDAMQDVLDAAARLESRAYLVSLEFIGENVTSLTECRQAVQQFRELIRSAGAMGRPGRISLDLSHIGLSIDSELASQHLQELAQEAGLNGCTLMISMEESAKTDSILALYKEAASRYPQIGITLQAHLYRAPGDLEELLPLQGSLRIVKGAYQEPALQAMPRSEALNERFAALVRRCIQAKRFVSAATHDEPLIEKLVQEGLLHSEHAELEMLYGIRPELSGRMKEAGLPVRIYLTYGEAWYLYLCHRLAEHPPNIYTAVTDMIRGGNGADEIYK